jgi:hypothetical protein
MPRELSVSSQQASQPPRSMPGLRLGTAALVGKCPQSCTALNLRRASVEDPREAGLEENGLEGRATADEGERP